MIPTLAWSWDNAYTTERTPLEDHYLHDVLPSLVFRPDYLTTLLSRHFVQPEYSPGYTQLFSIHGCGRIHRDSYFTHIVYVELPTKLPNCAIMIFDFDEAKPQAEGKPMQCKFTLQQIVDPQQSN